MIGYNKVQFIYMSVQHHDTDPMCLCLGNNDAIRDEALESQRNRCEVQQKKQ